MEPAMDPDDCFRQIFDCIEGQAYDEAQTLCQLLFERIANGGPVPQRHHLHFTRTRWIEFLDFLTDVCRTYTTVKTGA
jgi:hypothetical protein